MPRHTLTISYSNSDRRWNVIDEEGINRGFGKESYNAVFSAKSWARRLVQEGYTVTIKLKPLKGKMQVEIIKPAKKDSI